MVSPWGHYIAFQCIFGPNGFQYALETSKLPRKDITLLVAGAGTGGTITGLARAIRDSEAHLYPSNVEYSSHSNGKTNGFNASRALILAVDPVGSILGGGEPGNYQVEGIGYVSLYPSSHAFTNWLGEGFLSRCSWSWTSTHRRMVKNDGRRVLRGHKTLDVRLLPSTLILLLNGLQKERRAFRRGLFRFGLCWGSAIPPITCRPSYCWRSPGECYRSFPWWREELYEQAMVFDRE